MLSYRHGFHAGNHADVLKHAIYVQLLRHLAKKDKSFWCIDTHAGAALYALGAGFSEKRAEHASGIARLWNEAPAPAARVNSPSVQAKLPPMLADYLAQVRLHNPDGRLRTYPGSPQLALQMLRPQDRLRLFELHSTEARELAAYFDDAKQGAVDEKARSGADGRARRSAADDSHAGSSTRSRTGTPAHQVAVTAGDGFAGLKALLPPPPRRGVVLIDPSYEDKNDYRRVIITLREGLERFADGIYAIWYPLVRRREAHELPEQLKRIAGIEWLHATLTVQAPPEDGFGLFGSGMFIVNPPYTLPAMLKETLPVLAKLLGLDEHAGFTLEKQMP